MMVYLIKGKLPWQNIKGKTPSDIYIKTYVYKKNLNLEAFCNSLPKEFKEIIEDIYKLNYIAFFGQFI